MILLNSDDRMLNYIAKSPRFELVEHRIFL